jgi:OmpA-OmpF porin, OOP family
VAAGYGETKPVTKNDTEDNRQLNRRIELKII